MPQSSEPPPLSGLVPTAVQQVVPVVEQKQLARDTFRIRFFCPDIAEQIVPGQFVMVRQPGETDPLLGRPFALYDVYEESGRPAGIDVVYIVVGKLTSRMAAWRAGQEVEIWGPLGNGFPPPSTGDLVMVAGGIGQTPFLAVAREALGRKVYGRPPRTVDAAPSRVTLAYGVRTADYLAGVDDFEADGVEVRISTEDGSCGHRGLVTDLLTRGWDEHGPPRTVYCCGPEPMMVAVAQLCHERNVRCWLSLESPMACGFGVCFSCVTRVRLDDGRWDYRRTCVDGPVFPAERLVLSD